jgi:hypothetical protein
MPTPTDLVTDLPADFEVFGQAVDTSMADLKGGTTDQVLAKNSNTDMDFKWVTSDDANAIQNTIVDAKGDLIAASASDVPARLAVGANGESLVADSTAATGIKWGAPKARGCSLYLGSNFSTTHNTITTLTWDSEQWDSDGYHSTSTNTSRITIPTGLGGIYQINSAMTYASNTVGGRDLYIFINGTNYLGYQSIDGQDDVPPGLSASMILPLSAGSYVEIRAFQNSGGNLNVLAPYTSFSVSLIGTL